MTKTKKFTFNKAKRAVLIALMMLISVCCAAFGVSELFTKNRTPHIAYAASGAVYNHTWQHTDADAIALNTYLTTHADGVLEGGPNAQNPKHYYLSANLNLTTYNLTVNSGYVELCLNGYMLKGVSASATNGNKGSVIFVGADTPKEETPPSEKPTLNIYDCYVGANDANRIHAYNNTNGKYVFTGSNTGGTDAIIGGVITGGNGAVCSWINSLGGGALHVNEGASCNMYGGYLAGNSARDGGGVYVTLLGSTFTLYNGTICGNSTDYSGGVGVDADGTFIMKGGLITHNIVAGSGGAIYIQCRVARGGVSGSTFIMEGGEISYNTSNGTAGGVMLDGEASYTNADGEVIVYQNVFIMTGGKIIGNTSASSGGGIYCDGNTSFTMTGGEISGNTAAGFGGGIYAGGSRNFTVGGDAKITDNTAGAEGEKTDNNLQIKKGKTIEVDGEMGDADIGITLSDGYTGSFLSGDNVNQDTADHFSSDVSGQSPKYEDGSVTFVSNHLHAGMPYEGTPITEAGTLSAGSYYLTQDITGNFTVEGTVTLCLFGYSITATTGSAFTIPSGSSLTLEDCGSGKIYGGTGTSVTIGSATYTAGGGVYVEGALTMKCGTVTGGNCNRGGGVFVSGSSASFALQSGMISNNTASQGGGVYVYDSAKFTMTGGRITGNTSSSHGGGVSLQSYAAMTLSGGEISNNTVQGSSVGGGIYMADYATLTITGGKISSNTGCEGGGLYMVTGCEAIMNGGEISSNSVMPYGSATAYGAGIRICGGTICTFTMNGGKISGNRSPGAAAALNMGGGTVFNLNGGEICDNVSNGNGIISGAGTFYMNGGIITRNIARNGSAFTLDSSTKAYFTGGTITGNISTEAGGAVYYNQPACVLNIGGSAQIYGNTSLDKPGNIYLLEDRIVNIISTFTSSAKVGVTLVEAYGDKAFTSGYSAYNRLHPDNYFFVDYVSGTTGNVVLEGNEVKVSKTAYYHTHNGTNFTGTAITSLTGLEDGKMYFLDADITGNVTITNNIELCLFGHSIRGDGTGPVITVAEGAVLTLHDCQGGMITGGKSANGGGILIYGELVMDGGSVTGNTATENGGGVYVGGGSFTLGGTASIFENTAKNGAGVYVSGVSFTLGEGAGVLNNTASGKGGGVYVEDGKLFMNGGAIGTNEALSGAGVYAENANLVLAGGVISGNREAENGGGMSVDGGSVTINGTTLLGNNATLGGGVYMIGGATVNMLSGSVSSNVASSAGGVYLSGANTRLIVESGSLSSNAARAGSGGAVYVTSGAALTLNGGTLASNTASSRAAVYVDGSTLMMTGGKISGTATGGVYVLNGAKFTMSGGAIYNNSASTSGGVGVSGSSFTMSGTAEIYSNSATYGAGVNIHDGSTFIMSGGKIYKNRATSLGGGVYLSMTSGACTFTMTGGEIVQNSAPTGAGVYSYGCAFQLQGGTIAENTATTWGGGVRMSSGAAFTMSGGTITDNMAGASAGGVYVQAPSTMTMTGGEITGNTAATSAGGLYSEGTFTVSGAVKISGNALTSGELQNLYLPRDKIVTIGSRGLTAGAAIGVSVEDGYGDCVFTYGLANGDEKYLFADSGSKAIVLDEVSGQAKLIDRAAAGEGFEVEHNHGSVSFTRIDALIDPESEEPIEVASGNYYLPDNVTAGLIITGDVVFCLNGRTLTGAGGSVVTVAAGATFTLCDCIGGGKITGGSGTDIPKADSETVDNVGGGVYVEGSRTVEIDNGETPEEAVAEEDDEDADSKQIVIPGGKFVMNGGIISGNVSATHGGGVYIGSGAEFEFNDGYIIKNGSARGAGVYVLGGTLTVTGGTVGGSSANGNTAIANGGGVYVSSGSFELRGGTISYNTATGECGGVLLTGTTVGIMTGGTISNNTAGTCGAGVTVSGGGSFTLKGGTISDNSGAYGGGVEVHNGSFTMEGGTISGNSVTGNGGGGVYINGADSSFTMSSGTISGNTASANGGGVFVSAGTFEMSGGTVSGNTAPGYAGVRVQSGAQFTMSGGTITDNIATTGVGGVGVTGSGSKFTMTGGTITRNVTQTYGGGVCLLDGGEFAMEGGSITNNTAADIGGGGVYIDSGSFTMSATAVISGNTGVHGAGVYMLGGNTFTMTGGSITNNIATIDGGGVYVIGTGAFSVSGDALVSGNTANGWVDNVCLSGAQITLEGELTNKLGVTLADYTAAKTNGYTVLANASTVTENIQSYFVSDNSAYCISDSGILKQHVTGIAGGSLAGRDADRHWYESAEPCSNCGTGYVYEDHKWGAWSALDITGSGADMKVSRTRSCIVCGEAQELFYTVTTLDVSIAKLDYTYLDALDMSSVTVVARFISSEDYFDRTLGLDEYTVTYLNGDTCFRYGKSLEIRFSYTAGSKTVTYTYGDFTVSLLQTDVGVEFTVPDHIYGMEDLPELTILWERSGNEMKVGGSVAWYDESGALLTELEAGRKYTIHWVWTGPNERYAEVIGKGFTFVVEVEEDRLPTLKAEAIAELEAHVAGLNAVIESRTDISRNEKDALKAGLQEILGQAIEDIKAATTAGEIVDIVEAAKAAMGDQADELYEKRVTAKAAIDAALAKAEAAISDLLIANKLTTDEAVALRKQFREAAEEAKAAIEVAKTAEAIDAIVEEYAGKQVSGSEDREDGKFDKELDDVLVGKKALAKEELEEYAKAKRLVLNERTDLEGELKRLILEQIDYELKKGKAAIDEATSEAQIVAALAAGKAGIDLAEGKAQGKQAIREALEEAAAALTARGEDAEDALTPAEAAELIEQLKEKTEAAEAAIDDARTQAEIDEIVKGLIGTPKDPEDPDGEKEGGEFGDIVDDALAGKKLQAKKSLEEYAESVKASVNAGAAAAIDEIVNTAKSDIDAAETEEAIQDIVEQAKADIIAAAAAKDDLYEYREQAKAEIEKALRKAYDAIDELNLGTEESGALKRRFEDKANAAKAAIDAAKTRAEIDEIVKAFAGEKVEGEGGEGGEDDEREGGELEKELEDALAGKRALAKEELEKYAAAANEALDGRDDLSENLKKVARAQIAEEVGKAEARIDAAEEVLDIQTAVREGKAGIDLAVAKAAGYAEIDKALERAYAKVNELVENDELDGEGADAIRNQLEKEAATARAAIDAASTKEEIDAIVEAFAGKEIEGGKREEGRLDEVVTDTLAAAKAKAKEALDAYAAEKEAEYLASTEEDDLQALYREEVAAALEKAKAAIDAVTKEEEVEPTEEAGERLIDLAKSKAEAKKKIRDALAKAEAEIESRVPDEMSEEEAEELLDDLRKKAEEAEDDVDDADDEDDIDDIVTDLIGEPKEPGEPDPENPDPDDDDDFGGVFGEMLGDKLAGARLAAKKELKAHAEYLYGILYARTDLSQKEKDERWSEIEEILASYIEDEGNIDQAETAEELAQLIQAAKEEMGDCADKLYEYRQAAKAEIDKALARANAIADTYENADALKAWLKAEAEAAKAAIEVAKTAEEIDEIVEKFAGTKVEGEGGGEDDEDEREGGVLEDIVTDRLAVEKANARAAIEAAGKAAKEALDGNFTLTAEMVERIREQIDYEVEKALAGIEAAKAEEDVEEALEKGLYAIEKLAQVKAEAKAAIDEAFAQTKQTLEERVGSGELDSADAAIILEDLNKKVEAAKAEIDESESEEEIWEIVARLVGAPKEPEGPSEPDPEHPDPDEPDEKGEFEKVLEDALAGKRLAAKAELEAYAEAVKGRVNAKASALIEGIVSDAIEEIDAAETADAIKEIVEQAKAAIEAAATEEDDLYGYRENAKAEIDKALAKAEGEIDALNLDAEEAAALKRAFEEKAEAAKAAIDAAKTREEIDEIVNAFAGEKVEGGSGEEEDEREGGELEEELKDELAGKKALAKEALEAYAAQKKQEAAENYELSAENVAAIERHIDEVLAKAQAAIDEAATAGEIDDIVASTKAKMDKIAEDMLATVREAVDKGLEEDTEEKRGEIEDDPDLDDDEKKAAQDAIDDVLKEAEEEIENAETEEEMERARREAEEKMKAIIEFARKKSAAKKALEAYAEEQKAAIENDSDMTAEDKRAAQNAIDEVLKAAKSAIDGAADEAEVNALKSEAEAEMDEIVDLAIKRGQAKKAIEDYAEGKKGEIESDPDMTAEDKTATRNAIDEAKRAAQAAIDGVGSDAEMTEIKDAAKAEMDEIVSLAIKRGQAKKALEEEAQRKKDEIEQNPKLSEEEKKAAQDAIDEELKKAQDAVDSADSPDDIQSALDNGITSIDKANEKKGRNVAGLVIGVSGLAPIVLGLFVVVLILSKKLKISA